jgi:hypothetical protein
MVTNRILLSLFSIDQTTMKRFILFNLFFFVFSLLASAQENVNPLPSPAKAITKNLVYLEYGGGRGGLQIGLNYERVLLFKKGHSFSLRGTYGIYSYLIPTGDYYNLAGCYSYGKRNIHFETALGLSLFDWEGKLNPFSIKKFSTLPLVYVGCKLKNPTGNFVIKLGAGYPTNLCLGFGVAF